MRGMQPVDSNDPRPPNVQIAAAIRAAILTGELAPGTQLPTGHELARTFGVSRVTAQNAIRTLRDEGYVDSRVGSGVYVRDRASQPVPDDTQHPLTGAATWLHEVGHLKHLNRSGWQLLGVPNPETVAEHSFRVSIVGIVLAALEGADVGRTAAMCVLHDSHETRIGDVPSVGRAYVNTAAPEAVTAHQTAQMPEGAARAVQELVAEYEAGETLEAKLAKDADKIETLLQATEYDAQGYRTEPWRQTSVAALRTETGKSLAQAINDADPHEWWYPFAATYHELRKSTRGVKPPRPHVQTDDS